MGSKGERIRVNFHCPHCDAGYSVVRVKNESGQAYQLVRCSVCWGPLPATEGDNILKYLLIRRPRNWRPLNSPSPPHGPPFDASRREPQVLRVPRITSSSFFFVVGWNSDSKSTPHELRAAARKNWGLRSRPVEDWRRVGLLIGTAWLWRLELPELKPSESDVAPPGAHGASKTRAPALRGAALPVCRGEEEKRVCALDAQPQAAVNAYCRTAAISPILLAGRWLRADTISGS